MFFCSMFIFQRIDDISAKYLNKTCNYNILEHVEGNFDRLKMLIYDLELFKCSKFETTSKPTWFLTDNEGNLNSTPISIVNTTNMTWRFLADSRGFQVGAVVNETSLATDSNYSTILAREYNTVSLGDSIAWGVIEPTRGNFNYTRVDPILDFAVQNRMNIEQTGFVWNAGVPSWISLALAEK